MKKTIILSSSLSLMVMVMLTCGCKKSTSNLSESWNWKGTNYTSTSCAVSTDSDANYGRNSSLSVQSGSNTLQVIFFGPFPTSSCIDTVAAWGTTGDVNQVTISLTSGANTYQSTGGNGYNQTVNVTVKNGVVSVSAPSTNPAELLNIASASTDSAGVYFSIVQ
jgi:hypothetical protein